MTVDGTLTVDTQKCSSATYYTGRTVKDAVKMRTELALWIAPSIYNVHRRQYSGPVTLAHEEIVLVQCGPTGKWNLHTHLVPLPQLAGPIPGATSKPLSILVLMVDTLSRAHWNRNFPLTSALLETLHGTGDFVLTQQLV